MLRDYVVLMGTPGSAGHGYQGYITSCVVKAENQAHAVEQGESLCEEMEHDVIAVWPNVIVAVEDGVNEYDHYINERWPYG